MLLSETMVTFFEYSVCSQDTHVGDPLHFHVCMLSTPLLCPSVIHS